MQKDTVMEVVNGIRIGFRTSDEIRDAGLTAPDGVRRFDNIVYGSDPKWQSLDVYRPRMVPVEEKLPVIVSVHGGGWVYGDKELYRFYCMSLAELGFAVVNFTYRLAPEHPFPASIEDINSVFTWLLHHQEENGFDTDHIYAVGDSAGAHGLGLYLNFLTNAMYRERFWAWEDEEGLKRMVLPTDLEIQAVALNCGQYEIDLKHETATTIGLMQAYLPKGGSYEELHLMDVAGNVTKDFPPVFLMTATGDFLMEQVPILARAMMKVKVPFELHFYTAENGYDLGHVFHLNMKRRDAHRCNRETAEFFRKYW